jgi:hypothetical protein
MDQEQGRTEIINAALLYTGQDTILDPQGESIHAKLCAQVYDNTLEEILSGHPWAFAREAARMQQNAEKPRDMRFACAYQLPEDCARILSVEGAQEQPGISGRANTLPGAEYVVYGRKLYSNHTELQIIYTRQTVKPFEMTPQFRNYFAAMIALKLLFKITGGADREAALQKQAQLLRMEARHVDGEQTDTMPVNRPNLFITARMY